MRPPTKISKNYEKPFLLSRSKLTRLCEVIEKRFNKEDLEFSRTFKVLLTNSKNLQLNDLSELFELDNGPKNEIKELETIYRSKNESFRVEVTFLKMSVPEIEIVIFSPDYMWSNELMAEVEEQVERTLQSGVVSNLASWNKLSFIIFPMLASIIAMVYSLFIGDTSSNTFTPNEESISELINMTEVATTTDKKIDFIYSYLEASLPQEETNQSNSTNYFKDWKFYLIVVPLAVMAGILFYLFKYMYPKAIFEWGDMEEHYKIIVDRRKFLWSVVLIAFIVGAFASLFATGVTSYIL